MLLPEGDSSVEGSLEAGSTPENSSWEGSPGENSVQEARSEEGWTVPGSCPHQDSAPVAELVAGVARLEKWRYHDDLP